MGSGASKKSKSMQPIRATPQAEVPADALAPPGFRPYPGLEQPADPYRAEIPQSFLPSAPSMPAHRPTHDLDADKGDEDSPAILLDDNAPIPRLPGEARPESGTGLFLLDSVRLNGQWAYLPDENEIEMEPVMSHCIEKAFVRGQPAASFKFEGNPCSVSFRDMSFTVTVADNVSVYPVVRKSAVHEKLLWMADDQVMRPFIPDAEELVLGHTDGEVVFQMDHDLLNVNFSKGVVVDVNNGVERLIQLVEEHPS